MKMLLALTLALTFTFSFGCGGGDTAPTTMDDPNSQYSCETRNWHVQNWLDQNCPLGIQECVGRQKLPARYTLPESGLTVVIGIKGALEDVAVHGEPEWLPYCPFTYQPPKSSQQLRPRDYEDCSATFIGCQDSTGGGTWSVK